MAGKTRVKVILQNCEKQNQRSNVLEQIPTVSKTTQDAEKLSHM